MSVLPWKENVKPLMLAPMQGLTNEALRACYIEHYHPDLVFTEFVRVQSQSRKRVGRSDLAEIQAHKENIPLIVQLIGSDAKSLSDAALEVQNAGCNHINLNLGCPYGRMTTGATGGELLNQPEKLPELLADLRKAIDGSFSVKCRAGYHDPSQIYDLLTLFDASGVDFIILHPRTVEQKYSGNANHELTAEVTARASMPVIANGDISTAEMGSKLLSETSVAGLMLGRGALADPQLFRRIRHELPTQVDEATRRLELAVFIGDLVPRYLEKFCGERQALMKLKDLLNFIPDSCLQRDLGKLKRSNTVERFQTLLMKHFPMK
jgi:tRNA-dihydrouridine synthase B